LPFFILDFGFFCFVLFSDRVFTVTKIDL
jgi:hypothetical protein